MRVNRAWIFFIIYIVISFFFFLWVALPVLKEELDFQFYADSKTYEKIALNDSESNLVQVGLNALGPVSILKLLGPQSYFLIYLFNISLFIASLYYISRNPALNKKLFFLLVMASPISFTSLFSVNKEIISLLCLALLIFFKDKLNIWKIGLLLIISYLIRWQFTLFILVFLLIDSPVNCFREKRRFSFLLMLISISVILYYTQDTIFKGLFDIFNRTADDYTAGRGTYKILMDIQQQYGYFIAFIPKTLHLLVGMSSRYKFIFDFTDVYNNFILYWQGPLNALLLFWAFNKKMFNFDNDIFYMLLIYCVIFAITPIYAIRYFYPVYILLAYLVSLKTSGRIFKI